jgi:hypothetical protein
MRCVRFPGLRAYLDRLLDDIALGAAGRGMRGTAVGSLVQRTTERLDYIIRRDQIEPENLQSESRELLGWFRYFAQADQFGQYLLAVDRAFTAIESVLASQQAGLLRARRSPPWRRPLLIHFRPTASLYRWRVESEATRITLPTPMIVLDANRFSALARQMTGAKRTSCASESMLTHEYRSVAAALCAAGGVSDRATGAVHDLQESFDRVNQDYFSGQCQRPRLTWGSRETIRKFGHYDFVQDLVMLSRTLDDPEVPAFVIDHVMHHELLHKKHGLRWQEGRRLAHMPEFRHEERTFQRYHEADRFLETLSRSLRGARC